MMKSHLKYIAFLLAAAFLVPAFCSTAQAGGLFGPMQTVSRTAGGLHTAIAYQYAEDIFEGSSDYVVRQNQIYSQAAYGAADMWEVYGRIGISDLKISDAFKSSDALTSTEKDCFEENWKFFGSLGAKAYYPMTGGLGIGGFVQGTYHVSSYSDRITGVHDGTPFDADLKIKNLWDIRGGIGLQAMLPWKVKLYGGPYVYYAEAEATLSSNIAGLELGVRETRLENKSAAGGFFGADIPLAKGFRLNLEGQYARRLSLGAAVTYTY